MAWIRAGGGGFGGVRKVGSQASGRGGGGLVPVLSTRKLRLKGGWVGGWVGWVGWAISRVLAPEVWVEGP